MLLEQRMKQLLEDILHTLNQLPDRKVKGKDFTTYDLAKRIEQELEFGKEAKGLDFAFRWFDETHEIQPLNQTYTNVMNYLTKL